MRVRKKNYTYKEVTVPKWDVIWMENGQEKTHRCDTQKEAFAWVRLQEALLAKMSREELSSWNAISAEERRSILAAKKVFKEAGGTGIPPWREAIEARVEKTSPSASLLFATVVDDLFKAKEKKIQRGKMGMDHYEIARLCFEKMKRRFGEQSLGEIAWQEIEAWMEDEEWSPKNFNHYYGRFVEVFEWAKKDHPGLINPMHRIERYDVKAVDLPVPCAEVVKKALLAVIAEKNWPLLVGMTLGFGLGLRNAEISGLNWKDIYSDRVRLSAAITKNGDKRVIERGMASHFSPVFEILFLLKTEGLVVSAKWGGDRLRILRAADFQTTRNIMRAAFVSHYSSVAGGDDKVRAVIGHSTSSQVLAKHYKSVDCYDAMGVHPLVTADAHGYFAMFEGVLIDLRHALV